MDHVQEDNLIYNKSGINIYLSKICDMKRFIVKFIIAEEMARRFGYVGEFKQRFMYNYINDSYLI